MASRNRARVCASAIVSAIGNVNASSASGYRARAHSNTIESAIVSVASVSHQPVLLLCTTTPGICRPVPPPVVPMPR